MQKDSFSGSEMLQKFIFARNFFPKKTLKNFNSKLDTMRNFHITI